MVDKYFFSLYFRLRIVLLKITRDGEIFTLIIKGYQFLMYILLEKVVVLSLHKPIGWPVCV